MHIKSKMLLPPQERQPEEQEEVDPRAELVRQLLEYKAFKEAAGRLQDLEQRQLNVFQRPGEMGGLPSEMAGEHFFEASLFDLISAFSTVLADVPKETFLEVIKDETTVEEKIHDILHMLVERTSISLQSLFDRAKSKVEMVTVFLALLELIKIHSILAVQKELFGEIEIMRNPKSVKPA